MSTRTHARWWLVVAIGVCVRASKQCSVFSMIFIGALRVAQWVSEVGNMAHPVSMCSQRAHRGGFRPLDDVQQGGDTTATMYNTYVYI